MRTDYTQPSLGAGTLHCCRWTPDGEIKGIVQIVHGIAEYIERYDDFAEYLCSLGYMVVAEDHMGHGQSVNGSGVKGYFHGGWFRAVDDSYQLLRSTMKANPGIPYVLFGHSMGSFMARTILCRYPGSGISAAVICGTGWQPRGILPVGITACKLVCKAIGEEKPSPKLENMVFGGYNKKIPNPRTSYDWLTKDDNVVDAYIAHPMCGFTPSCGLLRDMMQGISYIEKPQVLDVMSKNLPVLFIAGADDPVGSYGKGVEQAADHFRKAGMKNVTCKLYPNDRHEILNETDRQTVYQDVSGWLSQVLK